MSIGESERKTQKKVMDFFSDRTILDYKSLGNLEDKVNTNIKTDLLREYLRSCGHDDTVIEKAIAKLVKTAGNMTRGIYDANKEVYSLLKYGAKVKPSPEAAEKTVFFIDFKHPTNNHFAIAEEVTVVMQQEKRPDIVIYLNGIAVAVIELKKSSVTVATGIRQNLTNQRDNFIMPFFPPYSFAWRATRPKDFAMGRLIPKRNFIWNGNPMASPNTRTNVHQRMYALIWNALKLKINCWCNFMPCLTKSVSLISLGILLYLIRA